MSRVTDYRQKVIDFLKTNVPKLREVDWYDGLFDETDLRNWSLKPPCAYVAVVDAPTDPISTGEINAALDCVMVIIDQDNRQARDADQSVWDIMELAANRFRLQKFGDPNVAPAQNVRFKRLKDPVIRRMGVAVGVVMWNAGLSLGTKTAEERDWIRDAFGERILRTPPNLSGDFTANGAPSERIVSEPDTTPINPKRLFADHPWEEPQ